MTGTEESDKAQGAANGLEGAVAESALQLNDDLLAEVVEAEAKDKGMNRAERYQKHPHMDAVQLRIERAVLDFCLQEGFQPYGTVMDAIAYLVDGYESRSPYFETEPARKRFNGKPTEDIRAHVTRLSSVVEAAFLGAVSDAKGAIGNPGGKKILNDIFGRYRRFCEYDQRGRCGERNQALAAMALSVERNPYNLLWEPWFNKLLSRFRHYREEYGGEKHKNSLI